MTGRHIAEKSFSFFGKRSKRKLGRALLSCLTLSPVRCKVSSGDTFRGGNHIKHEIQDTARYPGEYGYGSQLITIGKQ